MSELTIIGLGGGSRCGKDYLAENVFRRHGFQAVGFADQLKVQLVATGQATWEEVAVTKPPHIRDLLQGIGHGRRLEFGADYWVNLLEADLRRLAWRLGQTRFVITDCRYENELAMVNRLGGRTYRIHAPQRWAANGMTDEQRAHPTEQFATSAFDHLFDAIVLNDPEYAGSVQAQADALLQAHGIPVLISPTIKVAPWQPSPATPWPVIGPGTNPTAPPITPGTVIYGSSQVIKTGVSGMPCSNPVSGDGATTSTTVRGSVSCCLAGCNGTCGICSGGST